MTQSHCHPLQALNSKTSKRAKELLEQAVTLYDEVLEDSAETLRKGQALYGKGVCLKKLGRSEEALKMFDEALEFDRSGQGSGRNIGAVWDNKGQVLRHLYRFDEAKECYAVACTLDPDNEKFQQGLNKVIRAEDIMSRSTTSISLLRAIEKFKDVVPETLFAEAMQPINDAIESGEDGDLNHHSPSKMRFRSSGPRLPNKSEVAASRTNSQRRLELQSQSREHSGHDSNGDNISARRFEVLVEEEMPIGGCLGFMQGFSYRFGALDILTDHEWMFGFRHFEVIRDFVITMNIILKDEAHEAVPMPRQNECCWVQRHSYEEKSLSDVLSRLLNMTHLWHDKAFIEFFNLAEGDSSMPKSPEDVLHTGLLLKHAGGHTGRGAAAMCDSECRMINESLGTQRKATKFHVLTSDYLSYYETPQGKWMRGIVVFDPGTTVEITKSFFGRHGTTTIQLQTQVRKFVMEVHDRSQAERWRLKIQTALAKSHMMHPSRFGSFSPVRNSNMAAWLVTAHDSFAATQAALEAATQSIFIQGWFISPEVLLTRSTDSRKTLIDTLKTAAARGVQIRIMIFCEIEAALPTNSARAAKVLSEAHENIHVLRHPRGVETLYWSHHEKIVIVDQSIALVGGIDLAFGRYDTVHHPLMDQDGTTWPGKDFYNPRVAKMKDLADFETDPANLERAICSRMPWHDIHCMVRGDAAFDVARHFVMRWNKHLKEGLVCIERATPASETDEGLLLPLSVMDRNKANSVSRFQMPTQLPGAFGGIGYRMKCQILRSAGAWSAGVRRTETSIMEAYIDAIRNSKHFVYIENQFFMGQCEDSGDTSEGPRNGVVKALGDRIIKAITEGQRDFRVIVLTPKHPDSDMKVDVANRSVLHWQHTSIKALLKACNQAAHATASDAKVSDHLCICSLQTYDKFTVADGSVRYVTEQIYVHSKLMIVDDAKVFIGSANINDRSLLGDRDSEIVALFEAYTSTCFPGAEADPPLGAGIVGSNDFARGLRMYLMADHLGALTHCAQKSLRTGCTNLKSSVTLADIEPALLDILVNPESNQAWELWTKTAQNNSTLLGQVFPYAPAQSSLDDECNIDSTEQQIQVESAFQFKEKGGHASSRCCLSVRDRIITTQHSVTDGSKIAVSRPPTLVSELLEQVTGRIVVYPLGYLAQDYLLPASGTAEALVERHVFM